MGAEICASAVASALTLASLARAAGMCDKAQLGAYAFGAAPLSICAPAMSIGRESAALFEARRILSCATDAAAVVLRPPAAAANIELAVAFAQSALGSGAPPTPHPAR